MTLIVQYVPTAGNVMFFFSTLARPYKTPTTTTSGTAYDTLQLKWPAQWANKRHKPLTKYGYDLFNIIGNSVFGCKGKRHSINRHSHAYRAPWTGFGAKKTAQTTRSVEWLAVASLTKKHPLRNWLCQKQTERGKGTSDVRSHQYTQVARARTVQS